MTEKLALKKADRNGTAVTGNKRLFSPVTETMNGDLEGFESDGFSWKAMFKVQAKIQVLNATVERMKQKGKGNDMSRLQEKLRLAEEMLNEFGEQEWKKNWGKMKDALDDVDEELGGVGKAIRELNKREKPDKSNKGGNGKGNGE